jgi:hypothetical protein
LAKDKIGKNAIGSTANIARAIVVGYLYKRQYGLEVTPHFLSRALERLKPKLTRLFNQFPIYVENEIVFA